MIGKHVVIDTLDNFKAKLDLIPSSAIVLIKDVGQIYAHGTYFGAQKTYSLLTKTADGLAPQGGTSASSLISNVDTEWVLTVTNGENPTWRKLPANAFNSSSYTLSSATTSDLGGIKVGQVYTATFDDLIGQYYKINVDKNGLAYVHVPWVNNPYTASGSGITLKDNVFSLSLNSVTKLDLAIGNKIYAVSLDKNGKLCVSVPWTDTNNIFVGATETINGSSGMVPAPIANQHRYFLRGDGTWVKPNLSDLNDDVVNGKYLPLSGGTISKNSESPLKIEGTASTGNIYIYIYNKNGLSTAVGKYGTYSFFANYIDNRNTGELQIHDDGRLAIAANNVTNLIWHEGNLNPSDYLPKSGGTIKGVLKINGNDEYNTPLVIETPSMGDWGFIQFHTGAKVLGHIGMAGVDMPVFRSASGTNNTLIHSGNIGSQSVSYAATARDIMINYTGLDTNYEVVLTNPRDYGSYGMDALYHSHNKTITFNPSTGVLSADTFSGNATNADKVDGYDSSDIFTYEGVTYRNGESSLWDSLGTKVYAEALPDGLTDVYTYGQTISFGTSSAKFDMYVSHVATEPEYDGSIGGICVRSGWNTDRKSWRKLAFMDGNVASATKLQTARTIWGQSFDGSGNVSGNLTLENNYEIVTKNTSGSISSTLYRTKSNNLSIGEGIAKESNDTYISGNNLFLRYGTGLTNGISLISSGNVGIGITSPSYTLDVNGSCRASISVTSNMFITNGEYGIWKGSSFTGGLSSNDLAYYAEKNVFYGNVGIGTTSPAYELDVNGAIRANGNVLLEAANNTTGGGIAFWNASGWVNGTINAKNLILNYAGGNVGIGILNPSCKLEVNGPLKISDYIDIRESGGKNRFTAYVYSGIGRLYSYNDDTGYNDLYVGQNSTNAIVVKANGNVGIGTGSPAYKLDVNGSTYIGTTNEGICISKHGNTIDAISSNGSSLPLYLNHSSTGDIRMVIGGGNVGIGTTSPAQKLHVNGHIWSDGDIGAQSKIIAYGNIIAIGNIGVGTESPAYKLDVKGTIASTSTNNSVRMITDADCGLYMTSSGQWLHLAGKGSSMFIYNGEWDNKGQGNYNKGIVINTSNNVGIGTTSPVHKLDVNGSIYGSHYYGDAITLYTRGNGTYTRAWITAKDSAGDFIIEAPLTTESASGTRAPITLTWRGGYPAMGGLKITGYSEAELGKNKIWHAGNDGSGSGLDADLLDGYHISVGAAGTNSSTIYFVT